MSFGKNPPSISVFFPAYNDANSIGKLVEDACGVLATLTSDYEVIVVNDGSTDNTAEVLNALRTTQQCLRVIEHERNRGYGGALQSGFQAATKDLIFYTDGDGQYDVREIEKLYYLLNENVEVVNGYKLKRGDKMNRKLIGGFYNRLAHSLFALPIRDVDCDFRLIRKYAIDNIKLSSNSGCICVELVYKLKKTGARFVEVGVNHYNRLHGQSQFFTPRRVIRTLVDLFSLWVGIVVLRKTY
jgi:glycosyltransferase involved in cell wall biosynthesis